MLLPETEVQPALEQAQRAFPNFTNWNYINQANGDYFGFTMWGELTIGPDELKAEIERLFQVILGS